MDETAHIEPDQFRRQHLLTALLAGLSILAGFQNLRWYLQPDLNLILCLMLVPFAFRVRYPGEFSSRYGIAALAAAALFFGLHMQIFFLLTIGLTVLFILESRIGKLGELPVLLILLLSPVTSYLVTAFTFPIRLELSALSGKLLSFAGFPVVVEGNYFRLGESVFSVDPACMGLNTLITGFIITLMLIAFGEKKTGTRLPVWATGSLFLTTLALSLGSNLLRITGLALFRSMPETISHELIGMACLALYVLLPTWFLTRLAYRKWGIRLVSKSIQETSSPGKFPLLLTGILILSIGTFNMQRDEFRNEASDPVLACLELPGMDKEILENGIGRFTGDSSLLYIKPPARFWGADHSPAICWKASGYTFRQIHTRQIGAHTVYQARLEKGGSELFTAWWYDSGDHKTHKQWEWRWRMLQGKGAYRMMNLSATTESELLTACQSFLQTSLFPD